MKWISCKYLQIYVENVMMTKMEHTIHVTIVQEDE